MNEKLNSLIEKHEDWMIEQRRDIHQNPEPSCEEFRTSKKVYDILNELGLEVKRGFYKTGVVGVIDGARPGKTIALRFDMDALEMEEKTGLYFASAQKELMHACGHDGHTAMGLGAARILNEMKDQIAGKVKLIFQPAEEDAPGGGGAQHMIEDGVLKNPTVDAALGMHIWPDLEFGQVGTRPGVIMGASDPFTIDVIGQGVHASQPYQGIDPIVIGSQIVNNLQTIVSRNIDPFEQAVISIGVFQGGTRYNTIPDQVSLKGTVRTFDQEVRDKVYKKIESIAEKTASSLGGEVKLDYTFGYPPVNNDVEMFRTAHKSIRKMLGAEKAVEVDRPAPTGEDFAFFAQEVPATFLWLGCNKEGEETPKLHSPYFNFDEKILSTGVKVLTATAINWLNEQEV